MLCWICGLQSQAIKKQPQRDRRAPNLLWMNPPADLTRCVGQYMIGYCAGQSVKVQQMVGVDQAGDVADSHLTCGPCGWRSQLGPIGGHPGFVLGVKHWLASVLCSNRWAPGRRRRSWSSRGCPLGRHVLPNRDLGCLASKMKYVVFLCVFLDLEPSIFSAPNVRWCNVMQCIYTEM